MDAIRQLLGTMAGAENWLLVARQHRAETLNTWLEVGASLAFLLISVVGFLGMTATRRAFSQLAMVRNELAVSNRDLRKQIAQREEVESHLRQSQKMEAIGQLTGGIAHDFNNMLGVVIGSLDLMNRRIKNGDFAIGRFMEAATQATTRAASLTHSLLAFARQQPLEPGAIDVNNLIAGMSDLMRSTLGEQVQVEMVMAAGVWTAKADPHQLESAVLNVAINARDAMPQGGKLTIETGNTFLDDAYARQHGEVSPGQCVMVAVSDNGAGMSSDVAARVFDPFFTTKPSEKGTGLAQFKRFDRAAVDLVVTRQIVEERSNRFSEGCEAIARRPSTDA
jgi:signal transduction histidine kinase